MRTCDTAVATLRFNLLRPPVGAMRTTGLTSVQLLPPRLRPPVGAMRTRAGPGARILGVRVATPGGGDEDDQTAAQRDTTKATLRPPVGAMRTSTSRTTPPL